MLQPSRPRANSRCVEVLALPSMKVLLALYFLVFLAFNLFYVAFPVYAATGIRWSLTAHRRVLRCDGPDDGTGAGAGIEPSVATLVRAQPRDRWQRVACRELSFLHHASAAEIYFGTGLLAIGNGIMWPSLLSILSRTTDRSAQGAVQGFASGVGVIASIAGLLLGGLLYHALGDRVFLISAILVALSFVLCLLLPAPSKAAPSR